MSAILLILITVGGAAALSWPLGRYLRWAMDSSESGKVRDRIEAAFRRFAGPAGRVEQGWKGYVGAMLACNGVMFLVAGAVLLAQSDLPLNPDGKGPLSADLIFNTAASFTSNTNLQHYSGEVSMSHLSQMAALMWLQFVSAGTGLAVLTALARGLAGRAVMGNFYVDLLRAVLLVLLPLAAIFAMLLVASGVPMTWQGSVDAATLEGGMQTIARGPVAAFLAIKQIGTNGGGFFGPNSAHPFENPGFISNLISCLAIPMLPMACVWMFGRILGRMRHATVLFVVMLVFLLAKIGFAVAFESEATPVFAALPIAPGQGNLEGKELRFGAAAGPLWAALTTSTSNGSVNSMHDSLNALTGLVALAGMWLNSTFGGVGVGVINLFIYVVLAVFVAGMMVGRTPEYLGRRIEAREIKLAAVSLIAHAVLILVPTALFVATPWGLDARNNPGPHGFSEILYEFSSAAANNGSGFEGLADNTVAWNVSTGLIMLLARYLPIVLPLAIAGSLAAKRPSAVSAGTLGTEDATFGFMLAACIVFIGALTFFPAAALGPIADHLLASR